MKRKTGKSGFTLVELLVVLAIIGILITAALAALSNARARARDARREGDMNTLTKALALYLSMKDAYPTTAGANVTINGSDTVSQQLATVSVLQGKLIDPADGAALGSQTLHYYYLSDGNSYTITFCLETGSPADCSHTLSGRERG